MALACNGIMWLAGFYNGTYSIGYSYDGINWTGSTAASNILLPVYSIAWNGNIWIAAGYGGTYTIIHSFDGITWNPSTRAGGQTLVFNNQCNSVAWNGSLWVAVGEGVENQIANSENGIIWTYSSSIPTSNSYKSIAWNGSIWIAGDTQGNIVTSSDGNTWTINTQATTLAGTNGINAIVSRNILPYTGTNIFAGTKIYAGSGIPPSTLGKIGDFYIDFTNFMFYGPKTM